MSQVKLIPVEDAQGEVLALYNTMIKSRGTVANLFLALGHSPKLLAPAMALAAFVGEEGTAVTVLHKQLAYLAASRLNGCHYCLTRHARAAASAGLLPAQLEAVLAETGDLKTNEVFSEQEQSLIRYAEELTAGIKASPQTIARLRKYYDEAAFLEITYVVATANMFNRLADGLEIELEPS